MASKKKTTSKRPTKVKTRRQPASKATPVERDEFPSAGLPQAGNFPAVDRSASKRTTQELSWLEFDRQVQSLARQAHKSFKPNAVVGLAHGGVFVGGAIASALKVEFFPVRLTSRSRDIRKAGLADEMPRELKGRRVLLVDDVAGSGDSLEMAVKLAKAMGASRITTAALVSRPDGFAPDFTAYVSSTFYVFPWDYQDVIEDARFDPDTAGA